MPQANYQLYITDVMQLARTMVLKSNATADAINNYLSQLGYAVDPNNPASWKYYLNMAGAYHAFDTPMTVQSLDTQQTIVFNVSNLAIHLATKRAYAFGTTYYNDLVNRYPEQEKLILGILNPVNVTAAVAADDHTILWLDPNLVESNEVNLQPNLQTWISGAMHRWNVPEYNIVEPELYLAAQLAMVFAFIPAAILNIRLANCKTLYAHSFHVKEYLASNGGLDVFYDQMPLSLSLWLYRNIRYIMRNPGTTETFKLLVDNVLTPAGIPLANFKMQFNLANMPAQVQPGIEYTRSAVNLGYNLSGTNTRDTDQILTEEQPLARSNLALQSYYDTAIDAEFQVGKQDSLPTKVLESNMTDDSDASPFPLSAMLLNEWLYMAYTGQFASFVEVNNPAKATSYMLNVADAFVLYSYCFYAQYGIQLDTIPVFMAKCVLKGTLPTLAQMEAMTDGVHVTSAILQQALNEVPTDAWRVYLSIQAFYNGVSEIHAGLINQWIIWCQQQSFQGRAQAEAAILSCYEDVAINLSPAISNYNNWLASRNIDLSNMSPTQFGSLATQLLQTATGTDLQTTTDIGVIQKSMLGIMAKLSSYTIQFIQVITPSGLYVASWAAPRVGDMRRRDHMTTYLNTDPFYASSEEAKFLYKFSRQRDVNLDLPVATINLKLSASLDITVDTDVRSWVSYRCNMMMPKVAFTVIDPAIVDISTLTEVGTVMGYQPIALTPVSNSLLYNTDNTYPNVASTTEVSFTAQSSGSTGS
ncbi:MAG TPA: hypothetical protein VN081_02605 [Dongiaceae bacterium]|nr:hypothetical protein [Dongiaceae bacterium]